MSKIIIKKYSDRVEYRLNGELHREDGPAKEYTNGDKFWYLNDKLHREGGPAIEYYNGEKHWYLNGKRHRKNGPAVEYRNGKKEYWIDGNELPFITDDQSLILLVDLFIDKNFSKENGINN